MAVRETYADTLHPGKISTDLEINVSRLKAMIPQEIHESGFVQKPQQLIIETPDSIVSSFGNLMDS